MTTALAEQLARIRSKSTNALDLKAQKRAHSQSLLFDARTAATQNFETLYQICYEGYEELCVLDASYRIFAASLFGEQSKQQDRTQMTTTQNDQLNTSIEDFLRLVGSRLLLKPALKAVEWLVRRFRSVRKTALPCVSTAGCIGLRCNARQSSRIQHAMSRIHILTLSWSTYISGLALPPTSATPADIELSPPLYSFSSLPTTPYSCFFFF